MSIDDNNNAAAPPSAVEGIKESSDRLRGGIGGGLQNPLSGAFAESDTALIKFHGIYQQDNRDTRAARAERMLEPDYSFMIRLRIPGGLLSGGQWLAVDSAARELSTVGSLRLTTRQTLQFHGAPKENLRPLLRACAKRLLDSIAACGDVNRNVMASVGDSALHLAAYNTAAQISQKLLPHSRAYFEIWLGEEKLAASGTEEEPLYGKTYLPRKFKIAIAVPPINDVDVWSQDIGFVAVADDDDADALAGYNILSGGGLGMAQGDKTAFPRLGDCLGFCLPERAADVAWHIASIQRDYGNRSDRKRSRWKYTIAKHGAQWAREELQKRAGFVLEEARAVMWRGRNESLGWHKGQSGRWSLTLFVENGRIKDGALRESLREAAAMEVCGFLITPNQNLMLVNIKDGDRARVDAVFVRRGLMTNGESNGINNISVLREHSMACVALPTCPLAMAESERYLPQLINKLEAEITKRGLAKDAITIRMTGCPNGCARPYLAEIGLVGKSAGRYNLYLGASFVGDRLSAFAAGGLDEDGIIKTLSPLLDDYASLRKEGERFGDFLIRTGKAKNPQSPEDFHPPV